MKLTNDRSALDAALNDARIVLLIVFGDPNPAASAIHTEAETITSDTRKVFWISDVSLLTPTQRAQWYRADDHFTTLSSPEQNSDRRVSQETLASLRLPTGEPSARKIETAFEEAEL